MTKRRKATRTHRAKPKPRIEHIERIEQIEASLNLLPVPRRRGKSRASLELIDAAYDFFAEAHPATVRACAYHLFTRGLLGSMAKGETDRVSRLLRDAREAGRLPWGWVVDEMRELERASQWRDPAAFVATVRRSYRRDFWESQPRRCEIWSEKGTVRGTLSPILDRFGVGFRVLHGYGSATTVHDIAEGSGDADRPLVAGYCGDYDCSGLHMSNVDLPDRLERYGAATVEVRRIALVKGDLAGLPSYPAKRSDPRFQWYVARYGVRAWEIDAMNPRSLRARVERFITSIIEPEAWARCERAQAAEETSLQAVLDKWPGLAHGHDGPASP